MKAPRCLIIALAGLGLSSAQATTINILSGSDMTGTTQWNNNTGANVLINPYPSPVWAAPSLGGQWISYIPSGHGQTVVPNATISGGVVISPPTAIFYDWFNLPDPSVSGGIWIWADDTAAILIDNVPVFPLGSPLVAGMYCTAEGIGCRPEHGGFVSLAGLGAGAHTLEFETYQLWGDTFGLLYEGSVTTAASVTTGTTVTTPADPPVAVPEPSSFVLLGSGAVLALRFWRGKMLCRTGR